MADFNELVLPRRVGIIRCTFVGMSEIKNLLVSPCNVILTYSTPITL